MNQKNLYFWTLVCSIILLTPSTFMLSTMAATEIETIYVFEDTYVDSDDHFDNFGEEEQLIIEEEKKKVFGQTGWYEKDVLLKFDLTSLPSDLQLTSVTLNLYCEAYTQGPVKFNAFHCESNDWDEYSVTHILYQQNVFDFIYETGSEEVTVDTQNTWYSIDIKKDFDDFLGGTLTEVLRIIQDKVGRSIEFCSREGDNPPYLEITYETSETEAEAPTIPGFPIEAILMGLLFTGVALVYLRKRQITSTIK